MLVLSRKEDQSIVIGENITIKIVSLEKGAVKIGIDAPKEMSIIRSELIEDIKQSNKEAAGSVDTQTLHSLSELLKK